MLKSGLAVKKKKKHKTQVQSNRAMYYVFINIDLGNFFKNLTYVILSILLISNSLFFYCCY